MGSAPDPGEQLTPAQRATFATNLAKIMDSAGHDNNSCLRAYYFGLSVVFWLSGLVPFLIAVTFIVLVLYNREFSSTAVQGIQRSYIAAATAEEPRTGS